MTPHAARVFALNLHQGYRCRHAGACCTAGWDIPVERASEDAIRLGLPGPSLAWFDGVDPPDGASAVLRRHPDGACVAFDRGAGNLCAIQRACGHQALPVACQQFPRVALIDGRGVHVTLSHFCPTAARLLFADPLAPAAIVECREGELRRDRYEGFDATRTVPPFLRPGVVSDLSVAQRWEAFAVETLTAGGPAAEDALATLAEAADRLRAWTPEAGELESWAKAALIPAGVAGRRATMSNQEAARLFGLAASAVPRGIRQPALPPEMASTDAACVQPAWLSHRVVVGRYLAARACGAWCAYQGDGIRTQVAMLAVALGVLRIECVRLAERRQRELDDEMLLEAIRQTDLLVVHQASGDDLVKSVGGVEKMSTGEFIAALGLQPGNRPL